jgi:hypothetical protein
VDIDMSMGDGGLIEIQTAEMAKVDVWMDGWIDRRLERLTWVLGWQSSVLRDDVITLARLTSFLQSRQQHLCSVCPGAPSQLVSSVPKQRNAR